MANTSINLVNQVMIKRIYQTDMRVFWQIRSIFLSLSQFQEMIIRQNLGPLRKPEIIFSRYEIFVVAIKTWLPNLQVVTFSNLTKNT